MNAHNPELQRQASNYAEIRNRLMFAKPRPSVAEPTADRVYVRHVLPQIPLWRREDIHFDAHCENWKYRQTMARSPTEYVKRRCEELNIPYVMMTGPSRTVEVSLRRHLIIWEIIQTFKLSFPRIGKLMGGRDHTSVLHGFRRIDAMTDEERAAIGPYVAKKTRRR